MPLPRQNVFPGVLNDAWHREIQKFVDGNVVERLWKKDISLWPAEEHELQSIKNNLRWLDLPSQVEPYIAKVLEFAEALQNDGLDHIVFVAMGSSNLAAAAVLEMTEAKLDKKLFLLDSTDPDALQELESRLPFKRTVCLLQQIRKAYRNSRAIPVSIVESESRQRPFAGPPFHRADGGGVLSSVAR